MAVVTPVETADNRPIEEIFAGDVTKDASGAYVVQPNKLADVARRLRNEQGYTYLAMMTAVDYPDRLECVYYLYPMRAQDNKPSAALVLK